MDTVVRNLSGERDRGAVETAVERWCYDAGLVQTLKGTLAKHKGCVHWHFKKPTETGTLEITVPASNDQIWFTVQAGRKGEWIAETIERLSAEIARG